jgi:hypothetical protein
MNLFAGRDDSCGAGNPAQCHLVLLCILGKRLIPKAVTDIAIEVGAFRIGRQESLKTGCGNIEEAIEGPIAKLQIEEGSLRTVCGRGEHCGFEGQAMHSATLRDHFTLKHSK